MIGFKKNRKNNGSDRDHKEKQFSNLSQVKKKLITTIEHKKEFTIYYLLFAICDLRFNVVKLRNLISDIL